MTIKRTLPPARQIVVDGDWHESRRCCTCKSIPKEPIILHVLTQGTQVPEDYARWGGEGDCSLESWRQMYWKYIVLECERIQREPKNTAPMIMERFEVVYAEPLDGRS